MAGWNPGWNSVVEIFEVPFRSEQFTGTVRVEMQRVVAPGGPGIYAHGMTRHGTHDQSRQGVTRLNVIKAFDFHSRLSCLDWRTTMTACESTGYRSHQTRPVV